MAAPYMGDLREHWRPAVWPPSFSSGEFVHGGGVWLGLDSAGNLLRSSDGVAWEHLPTDGNRPSFGLAYGAGRWVGFARKATFYSDDDGETWTRTEFRSSFPSRARCAYLGGRFVVWLNYDWDAPFGLLLESVDGITWHRVAGTPMCEEYLAVGFDPRTKNFILLGGDGLVYRTGALGSPWTLDYNPDFPSTVDIDHRAMSPAGEIFALLSPKEYFDAGPDYDPLVVRRDRNGVYSEAVSWWDYQYWHIADGVLYLFDDSSDGPSAYVMSPDGVARSEQKDLPDGIDAHSIQWADGLWFASSSSTTAISTNLEDWSVIWEQPSDLEPTQLVSDGVESVLILWDRIVRYDLGDDTVREIELPAGLGEFAHCGLWDGSRYVIGGADRAIQTSPDGISWSEAAPAIEGFESFQSMVYFAPESLYIASDENSVWFSSDLQTWETGESWSTRAAPRLVVDDDRLWLCFPEGLWVSPEDRDSDFTGALTSSDGRAWVPAVGPPDHLILVSAANDAAAGLVVNGTGAYRFDGTFFETSATKWGWWSQIEVGSGYCVGLWLTQYPPMVASLDDLDTWEIPGHATAMGPSPRDLISAGGRFFVLQGFSGALLSFVVGDGPVIDERGPGVLRLHVDEPSPGQYPGYREDGDYFPWIHVSREGGSVGAVSATVSIVTGGTATEGADFVGQTATLHWAAGETGTRPAFGIELLPDDESEGTETIAVGFTELTGGATAAEDTPLLVSIEDSAYGAWRFERFADPLSAAARDLADPDDDGIPNKAEFALSLDPHVDDADLLATWAQAVHYPTREELSLSLTLPDVSFGDVFWEVSNTLEPGGWTATTASSGKGRNEFRIQRIRFTVPTTETSRFWRLNFDFTDETSVGSATGEGL